MDYKTEIAFLNKIDPSQDLQTISSAQAEEIRKVHPAIPEEYLEFLRQVGWGDLRDGTFMLYSGLVTLESLGLEHYEVKENLVFFGDGYDGDLVGFNTDNHYSLIELWHVGGEVYETNQTFSAYIRERIGMDAAGNDTWEKE